MPSPYSLVRVRMLKQTRTNGQALHWPREPRAADDWYPFEPYYPGKDLGYPPPTPAPDPTVLPVHAAEEVLQLSAVREAVLRGTLRTNDLIDTGRGWEAIADCLETSDVAVAVQRRAGWRRWMLAAAGTVLLLLTYALVF